MTNPTDGDILEDFGLSNDDGGIDLRGQPNGIIGTGTLPNGSAVYCPVGCPTFSGSNCSCDGCDTCDCNGGYDD